MCRYWLLWKQQWIAATSSRWQKLWRSYKESYWKAFCIRRYQKSICYWIWWNTRSSTVWSYNKFNRNCRQRCQHDWRKRNHRICRQRYHNDKWISKWRRNKKWKINWWLFFPERQDALDWGRNGNYYWYLS